MQRITDENGWRWYEEEGERYISVTQVLSCVVHEKLKNWFIKNSQNKVEKVKTESASYGSNLHELIEKDCKGEKVVSEDPNFLAWLEIKKERKIEVLGSEIVVKSKMGFAGQTDLYGLMNGKKTVFDFKTGRVSVQAGWQLAAYRQCLIEEGKDVEQMAVISLPRSGEPPKVFQYEHLDFCLQRFLAAYESFKGVYYGTLKAQGFKWLHEYTPTRFQWDGQ